MRVGEHSRVTQKYLDPKAALLGMFPNSRECSKCHTMIVLETVKDVQHRSFSREHSIHRIDWLEWSCPICYEKNQFTADDVLVNAHRKMVTSRQDIGEWIVIGVAILFLVCVLFSQI